MLKVTAKLAKQRKRSASHQFPSFGGSVVLLGSTGLYCVILDLQIMLRYVGKL